MFEQKVLLASDLTETSRAAESAAFALAKRLNVKLIILHVILERASLAWPLPCRNSTIRTN